MASYKKNLIVFLLMVFLLTILFGFSFAAERELEVPIPGLETTTLPALPDYIVAIYNFALMIIGIICFGALLYGGFRYLTSAGKPAAITDAKDQIFSALLGLIILFSSYLILTTINPELVILGEPEEEPIGPMPGPLPYEFVMRLYKDADYQGEECDIGKSAKWIEDLCGAGWNDTISSIKIEDPNYVAVIHQHINYEGKAQLIEMNTPKLDAHMNDETSSITIIRKAAHSRKVSLYEHADYETSLDFPHSVDFITSHPNFTELKYGDKDFNDRVSSITLERGVIAIIYEHAYYKGAARVFTEDVANFCYLGGCHVGTCDILTPQCNYWPCWEGGSFCNWNDVASSIQIVNGYVVTTLASRCAGFPETTCVAEGCEWCPKCSGFDENEWGFDTCVEPGECTRTSCSANCGGEWCLRCSANFEENMWGEDKCVAIGTDCGYTCSADCGGEWCPQCSGFWENPWGADTCVATGTCEYPDCSADCGGEWCPKCSLMKINTWGADKCVVIGTGCGYTCSKECGAICTSDADCPAGPGLMGLCSSGCVCY